MSHQEEIHSTQWNRVSHLSLPAASESITWNYGDASLALVVSKRRSHIRIEMKIHRTDWLLWLCVCEQTWDWKISTWIEIITKKVAVTQSRSLSSRNVFNVPFQAITHRDINFDFSRRVLFASTVVQVDRLLFLFHVDLLKQQTRST